jgi:hypothetical protein
LVNLIYFKLLVGDLNVLQSQISSDDGIVAHALAYVSPGDYEFDARSIAFGYETPMSLMNLIPALVYKLTGMNLNLLTLLVLAFQCMLMNFALLLLFKSQKLQSMNWLIGMSLFLINKPYYINLANAADFEWMPYAAQIATGVVLISLGLYLLGRITSSILLLFLVPLIHLTYGVWAVLFALVLVVTRILKKQEVKNVRLLLLWLSFVSLLVIINYHRLVSSSEFTNLFPKRLVVDNWNFRAVLITDFNASSWSSSIAACGFIFIGIGFTFFVSRAGIQSKFQDFILPSIIVAATGVVVQVIGLLTQSILLIRLFGARFSIVLCSILFLYLIDFAFTNVLKVDKKRMIFFLLLLAFFPGIFSMSCTFLYFHFRAIKVYRNPRLFISVAFSIVGIFLMSLNVFVNLLREYPDLSSFLISTHLIESSPLIFWNSILAKLLVFVLTVYVIVRTSSRILSTQLTIVLIASLLLLTFSNTDLRQNPSALCLKEVQLWIRGNSEPGDVVLADNVTQNGYGSWRNLTQRQFLQLEPTGSPYNYFASDASYNKSLREIYDGTKFSDMHGELLLQKFQQLYPIDFYITKEELSIQPVQIFCDLRVYKTSSD